MNDDTPDPYTLPDNDTHPANYAARLMLLPEHAPLLEHEVSFGYLMRTTPKEKGGKVEMGSVHAVKTMAQGAFKDLFGMMLERLLGYTPTYVIVLDEQWWMQADDDRRCALLFHELCHVKQSIDEFGALKFDKDGYPVFRIVEHDITAFNAEVVRFGAWHYDIIEFLKSSKK